MKSKLLIILSLLFILGVDGLVLAEKTNGSPAFGPDGVSSSNQQRRRRRARRKQRGRVAGSYGVKAMPEPPPPPPPPDAEPAPDEGGTPSSQEPRVMSAPAQKRSGAPRIKPPTVNIKPPTE